MALAERGDHGHGGQHAVGGTGQRGQHRGGIVRVGRLAQDVATPAYRGVRGQNRMVGQGAALAAAQGGLGLERADTLHVGVGRFAGKHGFERFGVFVVIGEQQFVGDAELRQQFAAARALGGEVEEVVGHGAHREIDAAIVTAGGAAR